MRAKLTAALIQRPCDPDPATNAARIRDAVAEACVGKVDLVVLQELHNLPYFCIEQNPEHFDLAESLPGPTTRELSELATANNVVLVGSIFEKRAPGIYHNTAVVFDRDGSLAGHYRKTHIPDDPGFFEKYYFTPGDCDLRPVSTSIGKLGVMVCWDQWFPEAARLMALAGADLLIYPTAIGWDPSDSMTEQQRQLDAWQTIQRSHAIANSLPVLVCNRVGTERSTDKPALVTRFWGSSFACGQQGEILCEASNDTEQVLLAQIDLSKTEQVRRIWPYLRDRRVDCYAGLAKRFGLADDNNPDNKAETETRS